MRTFFIAALMLGIAEPTFAQRAENIALKNELLKLEDERQLAYVRGDRAALERQFAAEYNHTNLRGGTTDRAGELAFYAPGTFTLKRGTIEDVTVHDYGNSAVLLGTVVWEGATYKPTPTANIDLSGRFRVTRVYVKRDGRWQLATSHASLIPPEQPAAAPNR